MSAWTIQKTILPRVLGRQLVKIVRIVSSLILDPTSSKTASTVSLTNNRSSGKGLASGTSDCPILSPTFSYENYFNYLHYCTLFNVKHKCFT